MENKANIVFPLSHSFLDYPSSEDGCISIFIAGCSWGCPNCQNKELQNPKASGTTEIGVEGLIEEVKKEARRWRTDKVAYMGGDPLFSGNISFTKKLLEGLSFEGLLTILYTGYDEEYVKGLGVKGWTYLKTGLFKEELFQESVKTDNRFQLASSNQKIYDSDYSLLTEEGIMFL